MSTSDFRSSKTRNDELRSSASRSAITPSFKYTGFPPPMASILEASVEGESIVTSRDDQGSSLKGFRAARAERKKTKATASSSIAASSSTRHEPRGPELSGMAPSLHTSRAWGETTVEKGELKSGSKGFSPIPETSSKTRFEMEALKKELAKMKASARASRIYDINRMVRAAQELDLAFLFDATSSMHRYLEVVKNRILQMARGICDAYPESHIRVAFVYYRDYGDDDSCGSCNFTTSFNGSGSTFVEALSRVEAKGGADTAEDVFSGLEALAKLDWNAQNRVVYHIADAPCHGTRFHDKKVDDDYANGDFHGRDIAVLLRNLSEDCKLSTYTFLHINAFTHKMLEEFKRAVGQTSSWILEDEFQGMDVEDIPMKVVKACKASISQTLSTMSTARMKLMDVKFVPRKVETAMPNWDLISPQEGEVYKFKRYGDLDVVLKLIEEGITLELEKTQSVHVQVGLNPFSNDGASRWPFYARIVTHEYDTKSMVVKRFKDTLGGDTLKLHAKEKYIEQMEVQAVSAEFAEEFNHCILNIGEAKKVAFTVVTTLQVQSNMFYNMEKVLTGRWTKFNSNAGYVNDKENYTDTLQAFSHWTHERSRGMVMVTDLQGVQISSLGTGAFLLCDPAIHSRDVLRFTRTNLGEKGCELFYKSHNCNRICRKLGLKSSSP